MSGARTPAPGLARWQLGTPESYNLSPPSLPPDLVTDAEWDEHLAALNGESPTHKGGSGGGGGINGAWQQQGQLHAQLTAAARLQGRSLKGLTAMSRRHTELLARIDSQRAAEAQQLQALLQGVQQAADWAHQVQALTQELAVYKRECAARHAAWVQAVQLMQERESELLMLKRDQEFLQQQAVQKDADSKELLARSQAELETVSAQLLARQAECRELRARLTELAAVAAAQQSTGGAEGPAPDPRVGPPRRLVRQVSAAGDMDGGGPGGASPPTPVGASAEHAAIVRELRRELNNATSGDGSKSPIGFKDVDKLIQKSAKLSARYLKQWKEEHTKLLREKDVQLSLALQRCRRLEGSLQQMEAMVAGARRAGVPVATAVRAADAAAAAAAAADAASTALSVDAGSVVEPGSAALQLQLSAAQSEAAQARTELASVQAELASVQAELVLAQQQLGQERELREEMAARAQAVASQAAAREAELRAQLMAAAANAAQPGASAADARVKELEREVTHLTRDLDSEREMSEAVLQELTQAKQRLAEAVAKQGELRREVASLGDMRGTWEAEVADAHAEAAAAREAAAEAAAEAAHNSAATAALQQQLAEARARVAEAEEETGRLQSQLQKAQQQLQSLQAQQQRQPSPQVDAVEPVQRPPTPPPAPAVPQSEQQRQLLTAEARVAVLEAELAAVQRRLSAFTSGLKSATQGDAEDVGGEGCTPAHLSLLGLARDTEILYTDRGPGAASVSRVRQLQGQMERLLLVMAPSRVPRGAAAAEEIKQAALLAGLPTHVASTAPSAPGTSPRHADPAEQRALGGLLSSRASRGGLTDAAPGQLESSELWGSDVLMLQAGTGAAPAPAKDDYGGMGLGGWGRSGAGGPVVPAVEDDLLGDLDSSAWELPEFEPPPDFS